MKIIINKEQYDLLSEQIINYVKSKLSNLFDGSCGKNVPATDWRTIYKLLLNKKKIKNGEPLLIVWGPTQTLYYTKDGKTSLFTTKVSTGVNGFGSAAKSKQTPSGLLKINNKIKGRDYEVIVGKTPTGKILGPNVDSNRIDNKGRKHTAEVLTGVMDLNGLENCNRNTFSRSIYFHGTNREKLLGTKRSNGCIRVSNSDIKKLINMVATGTKVYIYPD